MLNGHDLGNRTIAERAWLLRARRGTSQEEMAEKLGVALKTYQRVEQGHAPWSFEYQPRIKPTAGELCALARRRHGLGLRRTAGLLGCTHVTLLARERRSDPALMDAWRGMGYVFP